MRTRLVLAAAVALLGCGAALASTPAAEYADPPVDLGYVVLGDGEVVSLSHLPGGLGGAVAYESPALDYTTTESGAVWVGDDYVSVAGLPGGP